jgi:AraC-like DNA-binding protein
MSEYLSPPFPEAAGPVIFRLASASLRGERPGMVDSRKPVNEVALSLGYDNASSFATMFRRVTGQPPSFYHPA